MNHVNNTIDKLQDFESSLNIKEFLNTIST